MVKHKIPIGQIKPELSHVVDKAALAADTVTVGGILPDITDTHSEPIHEAIN